MDLMTMMQRSGLDVEKFTREVREELGREYDEEHAPATFTREEYVETHTANVVEHLKDARYL